MAIQLPDFQISVGTTVVHNVNAVGVITRVESSTSKVTIAGSVWQNGANTATDAPIGRFSFPFVPTNGLAEAVYQLVMSGENPAAAQFFANAVML